MTTWKKAREKSPTSIRKRMMMIFAVLISLTGLGIAALFIFVFRNGYSALSQVYLKDITRQTTNNLENNIQKIEDINLQILTSQTIQDQLKIVNEEPLDTFGLQQCRQKIERELATEGLYASYVVSVSVISLEGIEFSVKKEETIGTLFGFTEEEVKAMLSYYGLEDHYLELQSWYDGYRFGGREIYNPWSILNYVKAAELEPEAFPKPYWSNTSSNSIIRELVENADDRTRSEIERLMEGETIEKPIHEEITYGDIHQSSDNLWNFLYFTGYLKECGRRMSGETTYVELTIPNVEIRSIYRQTILTWFEAKARRIDKSPLIRALENGDCQSAAAFISDQLMDTISYFDYKESYYHGFMVGLCSGMEGYQVQSNRESGLGRADLILREKKFMGRAMILELKVAERFAEMEERCREALAQIEQQNYEAELVADGYSPILKYGVCFFKKGCKMLAGSDNK